MSSSSKSGTTRSVSPFAAMPPANVTWPPAVTAPAEPSGAVDVDSELGQACHRVAQRVDGGAERQPVEQVVVLLEVQLAGRARPIVISSIQPAPVSEVVPEPPHQAALADARHAADDDQGDRALPRPDELVERVAVTAVEDDEVGQLAGLDRADEVVPLERPGRVDRDHLGELLRAVKTPPCSALARAATLSSPSRFLRAARRPVGAEAHRDAGLLGGDDVGGAAVEEVVAERRPHHRRATAGEHGEVAGVERRAVDRAQAVVDRPLVAIDLQAVEPSPGRGVGALRQVLEVAGVPAERVEVVAGAAVRRVGDVRAGDRQALVVGLPPGCASARRRTSSARRHWPG